MNAMNVIKIKSSRWEYMREKKEKWDWLKWDFVCSLPASMLRVKFVPSFFFLLDMSLFIEMTKLTNNSWEFASLKVWPRMRRCIVMPDTAIRENVSRRASSLSFKQYLHNFSIPSPVATSLLLLFLFFYVRRTLKCIHIYNIFLCVAQMYLFQEFVHNLFPSSHKFFDKHNQFYFLRWQSRSRQRLLLPK